MGLEPIRFSGVSSYSADFQKILDRTVAIGAQPINAIQRDQTKLVQQRTLAVGIQTSAEALKKAVSDLGDLGRSRAVGGVSSNSSKVSVGAVTATTPATYTISDVTSLARSSSATSAGYASSTTGTVSLSGNVRLGFAGKEFDISLSAQENTLTGLRDKINALGAGVTASILTTGSGETPYYLSLTSTTSGEKPITLTSDPSGANTDLLVSRDNGSNANFKINGVAVSKNSNLVNDVVSGVTFTLGGTTSAGETVSVTLSSNRSSLAARLGSFVTAYNGTRELVDAQIGSAAGLLTGSSIVRDTGGLLTQISGYGGTGSIKSLSGLGVTFGKDGKASFDQSAFDAFSETQIQSAFEFLGSSTTGFGAMQAKVSQISDPVTGVIANETARMDETDKRLSAQVATLTERLENMQRVASERLQAVDAILGSLASQKSVVEASVKSMQLVTFGKNEG
ncbi:MAG: flagellar filament capping protein FliD [Acidobacteria bacterium]|nr:flagellar filament capping protein FliD [Acidobacteriota bacterium]